MTVENLYNLMEKKDDEYTYWNFTIYVDGIKNNILAYASKSCDVDDKSRNDNLYTVKDLFDHEVVSFHPSGDSIYAKINKFKGMKYTEMESYINEDGKERVRDAIKVWRE